MLDAHPVTEPQKQLLELAERWQQLYNDDVSRLASECYAPDAGIHVTGASLYGQRSLDDVEDAIVTAVPGRYMRIDKVLFAGDDRIVLEAVILDSADPDYFSPFCTILTVSDGRIVNDHTYLDPSRWPGLAAAAPLVTPGGIGTPESWRGVP